MSRFVDLEPDRSEIPDSRALRAEMIRRRRRDHRRMALAGALLVVVVAVLVGAGVASASVCRDVIEKETRTIVSVDPVVWSEWTDWPGAGPVVDDGRNRGPAAHNGIKPGRVGHREYRYVVVGQTPECVPPTTIPETTIPETTIPETTIPETTIPETTIPETTIPETTIPETTIPETTIPETTIPETTIPETTTTVEVATDDPPVPPIVPDPTPTSPETVVPVPETTEIPETEETVPASVVELPATGSGTTVLAILAGLLVVVGTVLLIVRRVE